MWAVTVALDGNGWNAGKTRRAVAEKCWRSRKNRGLTQQLLLDSSNRRATCAYSSLFGKVLALAQHGRQKPIR
jgi:hypothetical protein